MSGEDIAREVSAAIAEAGAATGDGTPLRGLIVRQGPADNSTYPPTPGAEETYACTVLKGRYSIKDRQGTNISEKDIKIIVTRESETDPRQGDKIRVSGETFSIVDVSPMDYGGHDIKWDVQARSG